MNFHPHKSNHSFFFSSLLRTALVVLTDGEDNSSKHSYQSVLDLVKEYANISLDIVHVANQACPTYQEICRNRGTYTLLTNEVELEATLLLQFKLRYVRE